MKIIYISSACNPNNVDEINKTAIKKLEACIVKFHNLIIQGLAQNNAEIVSIIGLPISKSTNKKIFWKRKIEKSNNIIYNQVGFVNFPFLKQITTAFSIFNQYIKYTRKEKEIYTILDAAFVSVLPLINLVSKVLHIKTIGIVADIYDYMCEVDNNNGKNKILGNWMRKRVRNTYLNLDGFVLLTEQMNEVINLNNKPYIVMEGCSDVKMKNTKQVKKNDKKIVLYSGNLFEKYGIKKLVEAFKKVNISDAELWIYGDGEAKEYIIEQSKRYENIKYKGLVSNQEVIKVQQEATLLVNPRPTSEQFTKYSFPSKNMEYMASGTPMLTTKLPGMPKEYYDYIYLIEDETIDGIKSVINEILEKENDELYEKGKNAQKFVLEKKNNIKQAERIIKFINNKLV